GFERLCDGRAHGSEGHGRTEEAQPLRRLDGRRLGRDPEGAETAAPGQPNMIGCLRAGEGSVDDDVIPAGPRFESRVTHGDRRFRRAHGGGETGEEAAIVESAECGCRHALHVETRSLRLWGS